MNKTIFIKLTTLFLFSFFSLMMLVPTTCLANYTGSYKQSSGQTYKGWPTNWWVTYYIQEFDKKDPNPGVDWLTGNSKQNCGPSVSSWTMAAADSSPRAALGIPIHSHEYDKNSQQGFCGILSKNSNLNTFI
jgi:hypothetical protein